MQDPPDDPLREAITLSLLVASIFTCWSLLARWRRAGQILPYEPRQPVPWGWPAASVAFIIVLLTLLAPLATGPMDEKPVDVSSWEASKNILGFMVFQIVLGVTAVAIAFITSSPNRRDLGLPERFNELLGDIGIGAIACLASIAPVFGMLVLVQYLAGGLGESHHPLVETVERASNVGVLALASISAVVFAPLFEEIVFRLLLQGWLEKWEAEEIGWQLVQPMDEAPTMNDECQMTNDEQSAPTDSSFDIRHSSFSDQPPNRGLFGLPYGWVPILISATLFALAHIGYGPEPVPLFVLALILGYVYQRTHRIVPCIVTHALFNLVTVIALWRMVSLSAK